ncbi:MAG TPA: YppG family protein [Lentibacillus sp.]|uniref:YppG family protein n=1 Tax=Lentibacillus sp. TaxID=1925746 RepID=UPI002B4ABAB7|nr:YppG family protein [Lentibacillus sp.]HLR62951.1 YppG family protein [Lentibacillus sp.]
MLRRSYPYQQPYYNSQANFNTHIANPTGTDNALYYPTAFDMYAKPKQPLNWLTKSYSEAPSPHQPKPNNPLYYFQDHNGELDLDKILSTAGQVADTVQQISPMIKQAGNIIHRSDNS